MIYACTSNGQDWTHVNIPSPNSPSLIAINKITGQLAGEDNAGIGPRIFHGEWSSPSMGVVNGRNLIFFGGGDGICYAFDATPKKGDGSPIVPVVPGPPINRVEDKDTDVSEKSLVVRLQSPRAPRQRCRCTNTRRRTAPAKSTPRPSSGTTAFMWPWARTPNTAKASASSIVLTPPRPATSPRRAKSGAYDKIHRSLSTVSITPDGLLFVGDFSGFVHCLDAETGKVYWVQDMKAHMWGSTLVADGKVYCGDEDGDCCVFAASKEKKILSVTNLGAPVYSTPVVANGVLYVHSNTHLFAFYNRDTRRRWPAIRNQVMNLELNKPAEQMKKFLLFLLIALVYLAHQDMWNWKKSDPHGFRLSPGRPGLSCRPIRLPRRPDGHAGQNRLAQASGGTGQDPSQ